NIIPLYPALVPFEVDDEHIKELNGLSLKNIRVSLYSRYKEGDWQLEFSGIGQMHFTQFGISGPMVIGASRGMAKLLDRGRKLMVSVNLKPTMEHKKLEKRIQQFADDKPAKSIKTVLYDLLPERLVPVILSRANINPCHKAGEITRNQRKILANTMMDLQISISGVRPMSEALVTGGGVDLKEVNPKTLESYLVPGLFFCGEILDIDGPTGGYNLTVAFSTGYVAGISAADKILEER
ncbi:MAG: aminoacetone oxidase family FAD-binding enzyme, partial [Candidatus Eremiobacteraeota bacterium]|nr:aminoacetone oxidase family FAD-binding enzyme [Candidatus Eremiobacteraeota bacterium]